LGRSSLDGTKIHADASKSQAVSYQRVLERETTLRAEVADLLAQAAHADTTPRPDGLIVADEVASREARLARLAEAKAVLEARARERDAADQGGPGPRPARAGAPAQVSTDERSGQHDP
jgi:hypothetical protein